MVFYVYKMKNLNYVGSTNKIKHRTIQHKHSCYNKNSKYYNHLVYHYIREKKLNIELEVLFCYKKKCSDKIQKLVEQFYINKYDSVNNGFNMINAFTNNKKYLKEYRKKNKTRKKETNKIFWNNYYKKDKIKCHICNSVIRKYYLKRHQKTKKCKKIANQILK